MMFTLRVFLAGLVLISGVFYQGPAAGSAGENPSLFLASDRCMACHNGLIAPSGADVSIGTDWRASMMANSARDPYWQAAVRREVLDHPTAGAAIENECSICHMPMARFEARAAGKTYGIFANLQPAAAEPRAAMLAVDGVSCTACHQIEDKELGSRESFVGGFVIDTNLKINARSIFGPFDVDEGRRTIMQSSTGFVPVQSAHLGESEICATCHTLYTHSLNAEGEVIGELPEQVPYLEWRHSSYSPNQGCPSCHLPTVEKDMAISSVLGQPRSRLSRHVFRGGNFFMPRILNRYRDLTNVKALPQELDKVSRRTIEHLERDSVRMSINNVRHSRGRLSAEVEIENLAGHKLPTAYPSRRVWIHFTVRDGQGNPVFQSGSLSPDGSIQGNDNDTHSGAYEPHYEEIDDPEKVQVYEAIMEDGEGNVTTGLLSAVRYIKDNRLLPRGFDKLKADRDVSVQGPAREDADFAGSGDRTLYSIDLKQDAGPYTIQAELLYQPIGYRWARNLGLQKADETGKFVSFYDSMAEASAAVLARVAFTTKQ
ncbi:MAG: hypothetical protein JXR49_17870 [Acidobacteria bacterium]|nr:hypothetical protein [Acidobacteriota bacterium]